MAKTEAPKETMTRENTKKRQKMIQDPQTMEIEEIIPDVMAEMVRMDKDAMEMARAVREEKAAMAREMVRDVMEMARAVREEKAA